MTNEELFRDDFEAWARRCVVVRDMETGEERPFVLRKAQRRLLMVMETQRKAGRPIRIIVLKARQWGCSTLVGTYMAWIHLLHKENWNSVICAQNAGVAAVLRGNISNVLAHYPAEMMGDDGKRWRLVPYEGMGNIRRMEGRGGLVAVCSAESVDSMRGLGMNMVHLSEVAFWPDTKRKRAQDLVRSLCSAVPRVPLSMIVMESTANGRGNFFHREWQRAVAGESGMTAVFVPWFEIECYRERLSMTPEELLAQLTAYQRGLMEEHELDLEQMQWYVNMSKNYQDQQQMAAEYPSNPTEAFALNESTVFASAHVERLRKDVAEPAETLAFDREGERFVEATDGEMKVWEAPQAERYYVTAVDVGGRARGSDWSVVAVFDCTEAERMRVVAQWRGHTDYDVLADMARVASERYNGALLAVESNSDEGRSLGIMERLVRKGYRNLYQREVCDREGLHRELRYGFHTNPATKSAAVARLNALLRDGTLTERSATAVDEMGAYVYLPDGSMAAPQGMNDDLVMTRAIAAYVSEGMLRYKIPDFPDYL